MCHPFVFGGAVRGNGHPDGQEAALGMPEAFVRGILCNALVCLAVWLTFAGHTATDKFLAILMPISAFVLLGFSVWWTRRA